MNLMIAFVLVVLATSKRYQTDYQSIKDLPYINQSFTRTTVSKTKTYQGQIQSSADQFRDTKLKDFQYQSRNEAAFVLPPAPAVQNFFYFKREDTKFIMQTLYEYQNQEQLEGNSRGIEFIMLNAATKTKVYENVFTYMNGVVLQLPKGPYFLTFRNRDSFQKVIKFQMGEEELETEEEAEDITKMSQLSDDVRLSRKQIHDLLVHHSGDLAESQKHLEAHESNQSRQYRNTIIQLLAIVAVNVAELVFLRKLLEPRSVV